MMSSVRAVKKWICPICEGVWDTKEDAKQCKETHLEPEEVLRIDYHKGTPYPIGYELAFPDGETRIYYLVGQPKN